MLFDVIVIGAGPAGAAAARTAAAGTAGISSARSAAAGASAAPGRARPGRSTVGPFAVRTGVRAAFGLSTGGAAGVGRAGVRLIFAGALVALGFTGALRLAPAGFSAALRTSIFAGPIEARFGLTVSAFLLNLSSQESRQLLVSLLFGLTEFQFEVRFTASEPTRGCGTTAFLVEAEDGKVEGEESADGTLQSASRGCRGQ